MTQVIDLPAGERMRQERFTAERKFETRYLVAKGHEYEFFGLSDPDFELAKATGVWPTKLERERPDFYDFTDNALFECIGCGSSGLVRLRVTKPLAMAYWCHKLSAKGYFAIYNSDTDTGSIVSAETVIEIVHNTKVTIEHKDNDLYVIPARLLGL